MGADKVITLSKTSFDGTTKVTVFTPKTGLAFKAFTAVTTITSVDVSVIVSTVWTEVLKISDGHRDGDATKVVTKANGDVVTTIFK